MNTRSSGTGESAAERGEGGKDVEDEEACPCQSELHMDAVCGKPLEVTGDGYLRASCRTCRDERECKEWRADQKEKEKEQRPACACASCGGSCSNPALGSKPICSRCHKRCRGGKSGKSRTTKGTSFGDDGSSGGGGGARRGLRPSTRGNLQENAPAASSSTSAAPSAASSSTSAAPSAASSAPAPPPAHAAASAASQAGLTSGMGPDELTTNLDAMLEDSTARPIDNPAGGRGASRCLRHMASHTVHWRCRRCDAQLCRDAFHSMVKEQMEMEKGHRPTCNWCTLPVDGGADGSPGP